jgi:hypothetical protein
MFPYKVKWRPAKYSSPGRGGQTVVAIVYHRMVGTLPGCDSTFANTDRPVSTHFGIGHDPYPDGPVRISQYVKLQDQAFAQGNVAPEGPRWPLYRAGVNPNLTCVSSEHEDRGQKGKRLRKGIVEPEIIEASIALTELLLSGDVRAIRRAGIKCSEAVAKQLGAITPKAGRTLINHNDISGRLKPYCWRPWAKDPRGFPAKYFENRLNGEELEPLGEWTMSTKRYARDRVCDIKKGAELFDFPGARKSFGKVTPPLTRRTFGTARRGLYRLVEVDRNIDGKWDATAWVKKEAVSRVYKESPPQVGPAG